MIFLKWLLLQDITYRCKTFVELLHTRSETSPEVKHFLKFSLSTWLNSKNSQNSYLFANNTQYLFANKVMTLLLPKFHSYAVFPSFSFSSYWATYSVNFDTDELHFITINQISKS